MSGETVLLADDEADIRMLVRTHLTRGSSCTVVEAADGASALDAFLEGAIDLVIVDQRMPELTGTEVARTLREEHGFDGPIVLFSAYIDADVEDIATALELVTVPKSNIRLLRDLVRELLDGSPPDPPAT